MLKAQLDAHGPIVSGQTWFLVSCKWWSAFKAFTGFKEKIADVSSSVGVAHPGPITSDDLLQSNRELRAHLSDQYSYVTLPQPAWDTLVSWYGLASRAKPVARLAIDADGTGKCVVEVYRLILCVQLKENTATSVRLECSRATTLTQMVELAFKELKIPEGTTEGRFWQNCLPLENPSLTLGALRIPSLGVLVLERRMAGCATWPSEDGGEAAPVLGSAVPTPAGLSAVSTTTTTSSYTSSFASSSSTNYYSGSSITTTTTSNSSSNATGFGTFSSFGVGGGRGDIFSMMKAPAAAAPAVLYGGALHTPGRCGLSNLGNTCFMNSALQCLSNTAPLTRYFLDGRFVQDLNRANPIGCKGELADAYASLMKGMWSGNERSLAPYDLKRVIGNFNHAFQGFQQHDAQELLSFLLDGLHEDLNRVRVKPAVDPIVVLPGESDDDVAARSWAAHKARNDSIVVDQFQGQLKSTVVCPDCARVSVTFDPFMTLSLPVPNKQVRKLLVRVMRLDPTARVVEYGVLVDAAGAVADLRARLGEMLHLPPSSLLLANVRNNCLQRQLAPSDPLSAIAATSSIYSVSTTVLVAYELPEPPLYCFVSVRALRPAHGLGPHIVALPVLVPLPAAVTGRDLYDRVCTQTSRFTFNHYLGADLDGGDGSAGAPMKIDDDDDNDDDNDDIDSELERQFLAHKAQKAQAAPLRQFNFRINRVNAWAQAELGVVPPSDAAVDNALGAFFAMDHDGPDKTWLTEPAATACPQDPSCHERVPQLDRVALDDCLVAFAQREVLQEDNKWFCSNCKKHQQATKQLQIWNPPQILVVHLKRFYFSAYAREKINKLVTIPTAGLDLAAHVFGPQAAVPGSCVYDLYAVSQHSGVLAGGHYTAIGKNSKSGSWLKFDDSYVSEARVDEAQSPASYVLLYEKRPAPAPAPTPAPAPASPPEQAQQA